MDTPYQLHRGQAPGRMPEGEALSDAPRQWLGGTPGTHLSGRWLFTLWRKDSCLWSAAVQFDPGGPFIEGHVWEEAGVVLLGGGSTLVVVELASGAERLRQPVDMYFGSLVLDPERAHLYVLGGRDIQKFDRDLNHLWTSEPLAVDGLTFTAFSEAGLHVSAERDPPGGWVPVTLDVRTGQMAR